MASENSHFDRLEHAPTLEWRIRAAQISQIAEGDGVRALDQRAAEDRREPTDDEVRCLLCVVAGEFFECPPRNYALPVSDVLDMVHLGADGRVRASGAVQSLPRVAVDVLTVVGVVNRDDIGPVIPITTEVSHGFRVEYLLHLGSAQFSVDRVAPLRSFEHTRETVTDASLPMGTL